MSRGKRVVAASVIVWMAAGSVGTTPGSTGTMFGVSRGFGSRDASSSYGTGAISLPTSGSSVGSPRDTSSGLGPGPGVGTTGGIGTTIGTPRDTGLGGGTTGGVNGE